MVYEMYLIEFFSSAIVLEMFLILIIAIWKLENKIKSSEEEKK